MILLANVSLKEQESAYNHFYSRFLLRSLIYNYLILKIMFNKTFWALLQNLNPIKAESLMHTLVRVVLI